MARLAEVASINPTKPRSTRSRTEDVAFLGMSDVSEDGTYTVSEKRSVQDVLTGYTYFERDDVLIAKITPCLENGKATHLHELPTDIGFGSTEFHVVRAGPDADARYLFYLLWNPVFRHAAQANMTGSAGQRRVPTHFLKRLPVPLPPLDEQRRIAAILDKADAIRRKRRQAIALTEELLRSTFLEMFGDIAAKKSVYPFGTVRDKVRMCSGKSSKPVLSDRPTDYPVYGGNGVNGYATRPLYTEPVVVVGRVGQQCGIVHLTEGPAWVTDNAIVVVPKSTERIEPIYLAYAFQMSPVRDTVTHLDLPFINQGMLAEQRIPIPPLEEQQRFAMVAAEVRTHRRRLETAATEADHLFHSLTQRAFRGDL